MDITIYRCHSEKCPEKHDRYAPRCGCPLSFQFNWKQASTTLNGNKLKRGQNKWAANTRSWSEAQTNSKKLEKYLENLLHGKTVRHGVTIEAVTIEAAIKEWLEFREKNRFTNTKPKLMGQKLIDWCEKNEILLLTAITTDRVMKFRVSLPFRTGDSSSLKVHWAVINGFFNWAEGMGYIDKNPIPTSRHHPQFAIRYDKPEVVPPTKKQIQKVLATATGPVKLLCELMRETAMALVDAQKFDPEKLEDETLIRSNRTKTHERFRVRISSSLAKQLEALGSPAFSGTYVPRMA